MQPDVALFIPHLPTAPERAANMRVLREALAKGQGPAVIREFTEKAPWQERLRARLAWALETGAERIVQLEDDVVACDSFWTSLRAMHAAWPDDLVCLAATHSMAPLVVLQGRRSYRTTKLLGWAFSLTRAQARLALEDLESETSSLKASLKDRYVLEDDYLAHLFIMRGIIPRHPCPTIVDHLHMTSSSGGDHKTNLQASVTWRGFAAEDMAEPSWWRTPEVTLPVEPTRDVQRLPGTCALCDGPGEVLVKKTGRDVCRACLYQAILAESVEHAMHPARTEQLAYFDWRGTQSQLTVVLGGSEVERKSRVAEAKQAFTRVVALQAALGSPVLAQDANLEASLTDRLRKKKNLIFCVLESGSQTLPFFREPERTYTLVLVLCHADQIRDHRAGKLVPGADLVLYEEGTRKNKFALYAEAVGRGQIRPDFDAVLLPDDDVFPTTSWSDVFARFHETDLAVAEPALTTDSTCLSVVSLQVPGSRWRQVNAVGTWAPILRGDVARDGLPRMLEGVGEGLEAYWTTRCSPLGVLDAAAVRRTRGLRPSKDSPGDVQAFSARHQVIPVKNRRTLAHVPEESRITAVTAIFGGYEQVKAPPPGVSRAVLVTDGIDRSSQDPRWEILDRADHGVGARRLIHMAKHTPHVAITDDDDVLWIDSSMESTGKNVASLFALVPKGGIGIFGHPYGPGPGGRRDYWDEAVFSANDPRYKAGGVAQDRGRLAMEQAAYYRQRGCPLQGGLWATGILVWRGAQRGFGEKWLAETISWSATDQIALPWVQHVLGVKVTTLPGSIYDNEWFRYVEHGHRGKTTVGDPMAEAKSVTNGAGGSVKGRGDLPAAAQFLLGTTFKGD